MTIWLKVCGLGLVYSLPHVAEHSWQSLPRVAAQETDFVAPSVQDLPDLLKAWRGGESVALKGIPLYARMGALAALRAIEQSAWPQHGQAPEYENTALIVATAHGGMVMSMDSMLDSAPSLSSLTASSQAVNDMGAGLLSLLLQMRGSCQTVSQFELSFAGAVQSAALLLDSGSVPRVLVGVLDEYDEGLNAACPEIASRVQGAVFFCLEKAAVDETQACIRVGFDEAHMPQDAATVLLSGQAQHSAGQNLSPFYGESMLAHALDVFLALKNSSAPTFCLCTEGFQNRTAFVEVRPMSAEILPTETSPTKTLSSSCPHEVEAWALERIPRLDERAFYALLQSVMQEVMGKNLPLPAQDPELFARRPWFDFQEGALQKEVVKTFCAMFFGTQKLHFLSAFLPRSLTTPVGEFARAIYAVWKDSKREISFFTSTGTAKACTHREEHIRQEISNIAPYVSGQNSALVTVPLHHMYGFTFGLLLPMALGIPMRSVPLLPAVVAKEMREGDLVVSTPLLWTRFMESDAFKHVTAPQESLCLLTATSPTPEEVLMAFSEQGFLMREFYGASEMGAVGCRPHVGKAFTLLGHIQRAEQGTSTEKLHRVLPSGREVEYDLSDHIIWHSERTFTL